MNQKIKKVLGNFLLEQKPWMLLPLHALFHFVKRTSAGNPIISENLRPSSLVPPTSNLVLLTSSLYAFFLPKTFFPPLTTTNTRKPTSNPIANS